MSNENVRDSYDVVAEEYASRMVHELEGKPFDRELLDRFAAIVEGRGTVADVGCGPGHVARYLKERGVSMCGVDLSPRMVEIARRLNPGIAFVPGDMRALPAADAAWCGIVAFYALIHIRREELETTLRELARVLEPRSPLLLSFHIGDQTLHLDEWWDKPVDVDFYFFRSDDIRLALARAGFEVEEVLEREPYPPDVEHQSRRCYILARSASRDQEVAVGAGEE